MPVPSPFRPKNAPLPSAFSLLEHVAFSWRREEHDGKMGWWAYNEAALRGFWQVEKGVWQIAWKDPWEPLKRMRMEDTPIALDVAHKIERWHLNHTIVALTSGGAKDGETPALRAATTNLLSSKAPGLLAQKASGLLRRPLPALVTLDALLPLFLGAPPQA